MQCAFERENLVQTNKWSQISCEMLRLLMTSFMLFRYPALTIHTTIHVSVTGFDGMFVILLAFSCLVSVNAHVMHSMCWDCHTSDNGGPKLIWIVNISMANGRSLGTGCNIVFATLYFYDAHHDSCTFETERLDLTPFWIGEV